MFLGLRVWVLGFWGFRVLGFYMDCGLASGY